MHLYYPFSDEASAITASEDIYDLNAPPRSERTTLYAFDWFPNSGNPMYVLAWEDEEQTFNTGDILDGITGLTEEEAIEAGYQLGEEHSGRAND
tara:strand:- start:76 stop:357 length:282 start_codon:yes stop_codon:yes gene_type:complete